MHSVPLLTVLTSEFSWSIAWIGQSTGSALSVHGVFPRVVDYLFFFPLTFVFLILRCLPLHDLDPPQWVSVLSHNQWRYFYCCVLVCVVFKILWRNPILIKICSVFFFLFDFPGCRPFLLYLIVSCGKFLSLQGFLNYCLKTFSNQWFN